MSFKDCIGVAIEGGEISKAEGDRLVRQFERLRGKEANGPDAIADGAAREALAQLIAAESAHEKRKAKLALASIRRISAEISAHKNAAGEFDVAEGALDLLEHHGQAAYASVEGRKNAIVGQAHARLEDLLHHFRRGAFGGDKTRWNRAQLPNVVREAFGENTGDVAAKGFAESWAETAEWLRQRFNAAGGAVGKLENWGLPQWHDARALRKAGAESWKAFIRPRLNLSRMRHPLTDTPILADELEGVLDDVFEAIATDGWNKREPKRQPYGKGALANQRAEHRFLVFNSPDDWMAYQAEFGGGNDAFGVMMGHINMMARDIAAMEVLGPNPQGTVEWLKQTVEKQAQLKAAGKGGKIAGEDPLGRAAYFTNRIDAVWGSIRGSLETPVMSKFAAFAGGARSLITSAVLGGASLSAISDVGTSMVVRGFSGIGAEGAVADIIRAATPTGRREAVAAGLILDQAMHVFHTQARYVGTLGGPQWASYLGDRVLTYSGLTPWTQAARHAFGLAFMRETAAQAGKPFEALHPSFRSAFGRYGLNAADWDIIRKASRHDLGSGVGIIRGPEIAELDEHVAERFLEMIQSETEYAVPSSTHRSRTVLLDQNRPGTVGGEIMRSFAQFKSFGAVYALLHGARTHRMLMARETRQLGAAYAGSLLLSTVVFGALATQLKQVAAGRDPRPMTSAPFWMASLLQGGGLGLYGDFFFADVNRYGGGLGSAVAGPLVERINDVRELTIGNMAQLLTGKNTNFGRELVTFLRGNVPGGNIFYLRLAWERMVLDQLQWMVDPEAQKAFRNKERFWEREFGQEFFWAPGEAQPRRLPEPDAVFKR